LFELEDGLGVLTLVTLGFVAKLIEGD